MACLTPFYRKEEEYAHIPLPCGRCPDCVGRRVSGWSFRLMQEDKRSSRSVFLTLTYNEDFVPMTEKNFMTLDKVHVQLFMKRLRKRCDEKLKYFAVGEYGGKSFRPHYHMILFNADIEQCEKSWSLYDYPIGHLHYGDVTGASIGYTLKYMSKPSRIPLHQNDDRLPEFSLMSKRLGDNYLTPRMIKWHKASLADRMYCNIEGGKKISMPRYYKEKIYNEEERMVVAEASRIRSNEVVAKYEQELMAEYGPLWHEIRDENKHAAFEKLYKNYDKTKVKL